MVYSVAWSELENRSITAIKTRESKQSKLILCILGQKHEITDSEIRV